MFAFCGHQFEASSYYQLVRSLFLDFFRGEELKEIALNGIEHVISLTATDDGIIFNVYQVQMKKSSSNVPRIELVEMGPSMDMKIGRVKLHDESVYRQAIKVPKDAKAKKIKNISKDIMGDKFGRIHVGQQNIEKLQTRKMKALKGKRPLEEEEEEDNDE